VVFGELGSLFSRADGLSGGAAMLGMENNIFQRSTTVESMIETMSGDGDGYRRDE